MEKLKILLLTSVLLLINAGCVNKEKKTDQGFTFNQEQVEQDIQNAKSMIYLFPSPGEILTRFYDADLEYNGDLLHDPEKASGYSVSRDKALNLGVYISDLAYSALFSRNTSATSYMKVVRKLSSELDISSVAFESLIDRLGANIGNSDSLIAIGNDAFYSVIDFLETAGRENTIALITTGAYIESMYIALHSIGEYSENDPILRQISELKYPLENLLEQSEAVSTDPAVQSVLEYTRKLNDIFSKLQAESMDVNVDEPGVITLSGGSVPDITADNFDAIKRNVMSTRDFIVGN